MSAPRYAAEELLGIMPADYRKPVDMREAIARFADDSDWLDFKADYGPATVCGHAAIQGLHQMEPFLHRHRNLGVAQGGEEGKEHGAKVNVDQPRRKMNSSSIQAPTGY